MDKGVRDKILDAALQEIFENGYQGASTARILERAGVSKGCMYYYFNSKKHLGEMVIRERIRSMIHLRWGAIPKAKEPLKALYHILDTVEVLRGWRFSNMIDELSAHDEDYRKVFEQTWSELRVIVVKGLEKAIKLGHLHCKDTNGLVRFIFGSLHGCLIGAGRANDPEAFVKSIAHLKNYLHALGDKSCDHCASLDPK